MSRQRQTLFLIDGSHYDRLKSVFEAPLDLRKLAQIASNGVSIDRAFYYRDIRDEKEEERQRPLFNWLGHHGFAVKGRAHGPDEARARYGTNLVEIAVDALLLAEPGDHLMILAGDAKLAPLFSALRDYGIDVTLISTKDAPQSIAPASLLIETAARFLDMKGIIDRIMLERSRNADGERA